MLCTNYTHIPKKFLIKILLLNITVSSVSAGFFFLCINFSLAPRPLSLTLSLSLQVQILSRLDHPNIISYYDNFEQEGVLMIEMEYADGG